MAGGLGQLGIDQQTVAILHQQMSEITELGLLAAGLLVQPGLGIGGRLMSVVTPLFAVKVYSRIAGIVLSLIHI